MKIADFEFDLPEDRIALRPAHPRDTARMLEVGEDGSLIDRVVAGLPQCLRAGDAVVFNDTEVIPARLVGIRSREGLTARIETTLLKRATDSRWSAFVRPAKRLKPGDRIAFGERDDRACLLSQLDATVIERGEHGEATLEFDLSGAALDDAVAERGLMPLPPYIAGRRAEDEQDFIDYQTVFARLAGSVAAPTAGLHFTPELLEQLRQAGIGLHFVTLHVGAGTFLPVKTETLEEHRMHGESGEVSAGVAESLNQTRAAGGRIVCVGTTSLRLLESAAGEDGRVQAFSGETRLFIKPGFKFQVADALVTNFHLPRSTLFVLVCAFAGISRMKAAYAHAVRQGYRFYSYGDASLIWRAR
ncbi:MAG TPA: tRNA preQ1(34) S-adenosylmethionine ribosyltransferase-isomerase QueA [Caulobacteraceae bacterium]|jgi:S-adenosylmethionine:tRNA ribosyltransferase-isomerase